MRPTVTVDINEEAKLKEQLFKHLTALSQESMKEHTARQVFEQKVRLVVLYS